MKKPVQYFLAGVGVALATIAVIGALIFLLDKALGGVFEAGGSDIIVKDNAVSPDEEYVATGYIDMGGGAAGWCHIVVNIRKKEEAFSVKQDRIFVDHCTSDLDLKWQDNQTLLITYPKSEILDLYQKVWSKDKVIKIRYAEK